jgi:hypothetical protein
MAATSPSLFYPAAMLGLCALLTLASCRKEPGEGGTGSIRGKVRREVRIVLTNPATVQYVAPAPDVDVYIVYGDHVSPDDRIWTNYKGEFEFRNLRAGDYTVYVYSRDTTGQSGVDPNRMPVKVDVEIGRKENAEDAGTLTIYDVP